MGKQKIRVKVTLPAKQYSEAFKKQVVREYERGILNKDQIQLKYNIRGNSRVLEWCRKYGTLHYPKGTSMGRPLKDSQKRHIKELEDQLKKAEIKLKVYEKLIEITEKELGTDIIKKIGARLSKNWPQQEK